MKLIILTFFNLIQSIFSGNVCPLQQPSCEGYTYLCPKLTEVTNCNDDGIDGYTTFRLSVVMKDNPDIFNLYALYGDEDNEVLHLPYAYQSSINYGSNIGGVSPFIISTYPETKYDSWLTIGISNGNGNNDLSSVGVDFNQWDEQHSLDISDGAIFLMNPRIRITNNNEYLLAQITVRRDSNPRVILNVQGRTNGLNSNGLPDRSWSENGIIFNLISPSIDSSRIPLHCIIWYDGCNTCMVNNGNTGVCTEMVCDKTDIPGCLRYEQNGN